jgi:hypothetical protein
MAPSITLKYSLTKDTYRDATNHLARKVSGISLGMSYLIIWVALSFMSNWLFSTQLMPGFPSSARLVLAGVVSGVIVAVWASKVRKLRSEVEPQEVTFIFSDLGVEKRTLHTEGKLEWKAYVKFSETDKYYFLHYNSRLADIVPKGAFATPQDAASFREMLTTRVRSAELDPHPRRRFLLLLILIFVAIMMVVWTRSVWSPKSHQQGPAPDKAGTSGTEPR